MINIHPRELCLPSVLNTKSNSHGFTLIEMLVALTIGAIVLSAVMTAFLSQHKHYLIQDDVVEMQQNGRAAVETLAADIRSAGFDPNNLNARITTANPQNLIFTRDDAANGLETLSFSLFDAFAGTTPPSNDGFVDDLALQTTTAGGGSTGRQVVAENIGQLEFVYLKDDGEVTTTANNVRAVRISLVAVVSNPDRSFVNGIDYTPSYTSPLNVVTTSALDWGPYNDNFRRRLFTTTIQCRNIGL